MSSIMINYSSDHLNMELGKIRNNRKINLTNYMHKYRLMPYE